MIAKKYILKIIELAHSSLQVSLQSCQLSPSTSLQVQEVSYSVCKEKTIASLGIAKSALQACLQNHFA